MPGSPRHLLHVPNLQVVLAQQMYDYVDAKIRMLDADLRRFDAELAQDRRRAGLPVSLGH